MASLPDYSAVCFSPDPPALLHCRSSNPPHLPPPRSQSPDPPRFAQTQAKPRLLRSPWPAPPHPVGHLRRSPASASEHRRLRDLQRWPRLDPNTTAAALLPLAPRKGDNDAPATGVSWMPRVLGSLWDSRQNNQSRHLLCSAASAGPHGLDREAGEGREESWDRRPQEPTWSIL